MIFFDVLPFTDDARIVNGKTSRKSVQNRRGGFWCVKAFKTIASFLHAFFEVFVCFSLKFYRFATDNDASSVFGKTSKKIVQNRCDGFWCVNALRPRHNKTAASFLHAFLCCFTVYDARVVSKR